ncbi:hypothetical protein F5883DRAFT_26494 [Diaporthe sp. PMI_573]|nr:hypothetical protein F5883DRAFT_26494 [Diaporthaceae sp. PMI_573]
MISTFSALALAGLMLGHSALCLPQLPQTGLTPPPGFTTPVVGPQPDMATAKPSLVTPVVGPTNTTTIDRTNAGTQTITTVTMSDGRTKTVPTPYPMPTIPPANSVS